MRNEIMDLLGRMEDLDPELEACLCDGPFGQSIKHPLVFSIVHTPMSNALVNAQLKYKKEAISKALATENYSQYIWLHERPHRLDAFLEIEEDIDESSDYWSLLGEIWVDSENIWQNLDEWRDLFEDPERGDQEYFMSPEDRKFLRRGPIKGGLPSTFKVYRGFHRQGCEDGFSWTLDKKTADWFARRLCHDDEVPMVAAGTVSKHDVIGYMSGRGEHEIVCLPENVHAIEIAAP